MSVSDFDKRDRADKRMFPKSYIDGVWTYEELDGARLRYVSHGKGYVTVRRSRCIPFVLSERAWLALPLFKATDA